VSQFADHAASSGERALVNTASRQPQPRTASNARRFDLWSAPVMLPRPGRAVVGDPALPRPQTGDLERTVAIGHQSDVLRLDDAGIPAADFATLTAQSTRSAQQWREDPPRRQPKSCTLAKQRTLQRNFRQCRAILPGEQGVRHLRHALAYGTKPTHCLAGGENAGRAVPKRLTSSRIKVIPASVSRWYVASSLPTKDG
jgi:hypothetical protein